MHFRCTLLILPGLPFDTDKLKNKLSTEFLFFFIMAYLAKAQKASLIMLTDELGLTVPTNPKISQLLTLIAELENCDEDFTRNLLNTIIAQWGKPRKN